MYIVYKIVNKIDKKFYIGVHKTTDIINNKYMGSGIRIRNAIKKYGIHNFQKITLFIFDDKHLAYDKEKELVNSDLLLNENCYNLRIGGEIIDRDTCRRGFNTTYHKRVGIFDPSRREEITNKIKKSLLDRDDLKQKNPFNNKEWQRSNNFYNNRQLNTDKIKRISEKQKIKSIGEKNSQWNTSWIFNMQSRINKKIKKEELEKYLSDGWMRGRTFFHS
jgi:hypothetical protein